MKTPHALAALTAACLLSLAPAFGQSAESAAPADLRSSYVLGPDDQITVSALDAEEISGKPVRVDLNGNIRLPMVGRLQVAGKTVEQIEADIAGRLKEYIKDPDVAVSITEFRSQPVSVLGSVKSPGVHQLQGR
jgi:protein involved in polysaccharide export with SLBB domain